MAGSTGAQAGAAAATPTAGHSTAGQGAAGQSAAGSASLPPATWRIAMLGDSITETTCMPQLVWSGLRALGVTTFDFVGTKPNQQACGLDNPDRDCEGHSSYLVTEIVGNGPKAAELPMWCAADRADLVMMHFGTNDAWHSDIPIADILSAYSEVVAALRAAQPHVIILVAQIIPLRPDNCAECESRVRSLNDLIPRWAESESTPESPLYAVDQWTGFDPARDTGDGVHPNMQGSQKMADVWLAALRAHNIF
ncbi:MAG TPA: SGNH/GDSL hydrolase family protein [Polyangiales bacterium]|nr:SGNH/GDSL hydrolase family protein [Polyangiales bacterium]